MLTSASHANQHPPNGRPKRFNSSAVMRVISYISSGGLETGAYKWQMTPSSAISITTKVSSSRVMAATPCSSKLTSLIRVLSQRSTTVMALLRVFMVFLSLGILNGGVYEIVVAKNDHKVMLSASFKKTTPCQTSTYIPRKSYESLGRSYSELRAISLWALKQFRCSRGRSAKLAW